MFVYAIHNTVSHTAYIGLTSKSMKQRMWGHFGPLKIGKHGNPHLQRAYDLYGEQCFEVDVLEECADKQSMAAAEVFWIEYFRFIGMKLYNAKGGGYTGMYYPPELRAKMREVQIGKKHAPFTAQHRLRLSEALKGVRPSDACYAAGARKAAQTLRARFSKPGERKILSKRGASISKTRDEISLLSRYVPIMSFLRRERLLQRSSGG